ncbi:MAG TPA: polymorphic toxin-type HINT domain-containing protein, partial [Amycolatopsis sp.]
ARSASSNADAAASAADEAAGYARSAGANASQAEQAAATARAAAARANRAANAAESLAGQAAAAARQARDAANASAAHADAAALAADQAAAAADQAKKDADAAARYAASAKASADTATTAANQAAQLEKTSRDADAARLEAQKDQAVADAEAAKQAEDTRKAAGEWKAGEAAARAAETQRLLEEAANPATSPETVVLDIRKAAVQLLQSGGPWTKSAAASALAADAAGLKQFLRTGLAAATQQDDRTSVAILRDTSDNTRFQQAARDAFAAPYPQVAEFLRTRAYPGKADDDRLAVQLILNTGGPATKEAANRALSGTADDIAEFLRTGQYVAAEHDDRIAVTRFLTTGGPEVQAAAQAALSGPVSSLKKFLQIEQFDAQQRDIDTATHAADVHRFVTEAASIAATARADAATAAEAAARARNAADEATQAAAEARKQADQAKIYADQARESAAQAQRSADQAAQSAREARGAAQNAQRDARAAASSATRARASAVRANDSAAAARTYAEQARASAIAAGKDADEAAKAADDAARIAADKRAAEDAKNQSAGSGTGPLTPDDEAALRAAGGQELVDQYNQAKALADKSIIDWIIENGGQILIDLFIGGIKACINDPGIVNCIMGAVDIASLGLAAIKAFEVGKALWRVIAGIGKFVDDVARARTFLGRGKEIIEAARVGNCFPAGTIVRTEAGPKPIEQVAKGERVWAKDPVTGRSRLRAVVATFTKRADALVAVSVGTTVVRATTEHPFWVTGKGWTRAADLRAGDELDAGDGAPARVSSLSRENSPVTVYNFEVDTDHDYRVSARGLLVHNTCKPLPNQLPGRLEQELADAARVNVAPVRAANSAQLDAALARADLEGQLKWAILEDGSLVVMPHTVQGVEISHAVLSGGQSVRAAGEATIAGSAQTGYFGIEISSRSGHFVGSDEALWEPIRRLGMEAFGQLGIHF